MPSLAVREGHGSTLQLQDRPAWIRVGVRGLTNRATWGYHGSTLRRFPQSFNAWRPPNPAARLLPARPQRRSRVARPWTTLGLLLVAALIGAVVLTAEGGVQTYDPAGREPLTSARPRWTAPCFAHPSYGRPLVHFCARVRGRVLFVRRERKGHGTEVHFVLISRYQPLIVKISSRASLPAPRIGSLVTVVGPLIRSRYRLHEVQARWMK